ncbi:tetratricopeptide repeat protein [Aquimarina aquimarini]|uniref:tetratricopeptide repeat protein n=1 Tax=Aquimarina aquimarini TaxID=1191734 RepID=UPI000D552D69|nr:tetratricopeptide repeat protein [Aquimarina aquimarini]
MLKLIKPFFIFLFLFNAVHSQKTESQLKRTPTEEAKRLTELQSKFYKLGIYETFKVYTDSILILAKEHNLKEFEIDAIIRLGIYYKKIDAYDEALTYYLQALELSKELPESYKKRTVVLINLGNLYNIIGYPDKAREAFNEASQYLEQFDGPDVYKMAVFIGFSESSSGNKKFKKSLKYLEKAKEIGEKLKRDDILIAVFNNMADNYLQLKKYEQSLAYSRKAEALYTSEQSAESRALSLYIMGTSLVRLKKYDEAITPLQLAQGISFTNEYLKIQMDTHKQLAKAFEKQGALERANMQQKGYIASQKKYLSSLSKAKRLEVEKDLANTEELLEGQKKSKWVSIWVGFFVILILLGVLFIYGKKKKKAELRARQLKEDQIILKDENKTLKVKIYNLTQQKTAAKESSAIDVNHKKSSLTTKDKEKYVQQVLEYMEKEQPYLDHEIKQSDLAKKLDISVHLFSEILNVCFEKNFNNFLNLYRVDRAKQLMKDDKYAHYKVLAIGYESGFASKTSFNRVFKQLVGQTPSEYRQAQLTEGSNA